MTVESTSPTNEPGPILRLSTWLVDRYMGGNPKTAKELERFLKFSVVGTIGFVVDFGVNALLVALIQPKADDPNAGFMTLFISTTAFLAAVLNNFLWNRYWTYPDSRSKSVTSQLFQFTVVNTVAWVIRSVILVLVQSLLVELLRTSLMPGADEEALFAAGYFPALVLAVIVVLFWNFFVNRYWTYSDVK